MKKFLSVILLVVFMFSLSACNADKIQIEDYEWKMKTVMSNDINDAQNEDELVGAVGEADESYPNSKIVDVTLRAENGEIIITDATDNKTYTGTYKMQNKTPDGIIYDVVIDGISGYATVAMTEYYDGSQVPTLPINLGEYSLYFIPNN